MSFHFRTLLRYVRPRRTKFAIWFVGRSGSSFLKGLIDNHPQAQCAGEILWPHYRKETPIPLSDVLDRAVLHKPDRAAGFKCPYEHLYGLPDLMPYLESNGYKIVRLVRENKLDQYLSMRLAQENGKWTSLTGRYSIHTVEIDPDHFLRVGSGFQEADERLHVSSRAFPTHTVTYDGLVDRSEWAGLCDFLNVKPVSTESPFVRQRELSQDEAIRNYRELKARCAGTFAEKFFVS